MFETTRGMLLPAGKRLLPLLFALIAAVPIAARGDDGMVDVRTLPRLEGAVEEVARTESYRMNYSVPTVVPITTAATRKLLAGAGWMEYVHPSSQSSRPMSFKKGRHGLFVSFSQAPGRPDQSVVYYSADRLYADVPFPNDATDIVYNSRRPYLSCTTAGTIQASLDFFRTGLLAAGWSALSAADITARWPNAKPDETAENGTRAYFSRDVRDGGPKQPPIMLALQRHGDGKTGVEIKIAPFAQPPTLEIARDAIGLPMPDTTANLGSTGSTELEPPQGRGHRRRQAARGAVVLSPRTCGAELEGGGERRHRDRQRRHPQLLLRGSNCQAHAGAQIRPHLRQPRHRGEGSRAGGAGQGEEGSRREILQGCAGDRAAADGRRRSAAGSRRRPACRMRRCARSPMRASRCRCRMAPRT